MNRDLKWLRTVDTEATIWSTCAKRQYAAAIVDRHGFRIGFGYNGAPKGLKHCNEGGCPRLHDNSASGSLYDNCVAIHAEQNALLHSDYTARADGCTLYVNGPPCFTCAKLISNSGIERLVYIPDNSYAQWPAVHTFLVQAGMELVAYDRTEIEALWRAS